MATKRMIVADESGNVRCWIVRQLVERVHDGVNVTVRRPGHASPKPVPSVLSKAKDFRSELRDPPARLSNGRARQRLGGKHDHYLR